MPKYPPRPYLVLRDERGQELHATWSRSGMRLMLSLGNHVLDPFGQVVLDQDQAAQLAAFLAQEAPDGSLSVIDEHANELELEWAAHGRHLAAEASPARLGGEVMPWEFDTRYPQHPTRVELSRKHVEDLASFIVQRDRPA